MARNESHKRRVFQDKVVRAILGIGGAPEEGNRYRQEVFKRNQEIQNVNTAHQTLVDGRRGTLEMDLNGTRRTTITTSFANRKMSLDYKDRQRGKDIERARSINNNNLGYGQSANPYRLSGSPGREMASPRDVSTMLPPQAQNPTTTTSGNSSYFVLTTLGANNIPINTVHINEDNEMDDIPRSGSTSGIGGSRLRRSLDGPSSHRLSEVDDGLDWEVLDGQISPGLSRLLALLWASMSQGRSTAIQGALREYSERFRYRLFGSAFTGKAELKQTGELLIQMMAYYGGLDNASARTSSNPSRDSRDGRGYRDSGPQAPFSIRRTYQHDPNLHNLPEHYHLHSHPSPLLPFAGPHQNSHHNMAHLSPSPPLTSKYGSRGSARSKINKNSKSHHTQSVRAHVPQQVPLLPNGEPILTEIGVEEMIILLEDNHFGQLLVDRLLAACPEEHKAHPAVRLAWLELYACVLYHLKLLMDPTNGAPKRSASSSRSTSPAGGGGGNPAPISIVPRSIRAR